MILNFMAGRRMHDPNHHPILPWVMDFTGPDTGFRDLMYSKFRLNKGDNQLDLTFESFPSMSDSTHIPHHVSDVLSDITYYVYKARRTPKSILCSHVRSKWVPNEYPLSMLRMQEWTPDECIPEFFTDPTIFSSIHEDLPDLEIPPWCSNPEDFISKHMAVLESDTVSESLHHWIDLTFGYKLTGSAAASAKNINLKLVDHHTKVMNQGVVQLFNEPHPHRASLSEVATGVPPRVPKNMLYQEHGTHSKVESVQPINTQTRDLQVLGCLGCELFLSPTLQTQHKDCSLRHRYNSIKRLWKENRKVIPRPMQKFAEMLLFPEDSVLRQDQEYDSCDGALFQYPVINKYGLPVQTPNLLLNSHSGVVPFPKYFPELYTCICKIKEKEYEIDQIKWRSSKPLSEKEKVIKVIARDKVTIMQNFLEKFQGKVKSEGLELILPYVEELFSDRDTSVQAAWSLFNLIGQEIGPTETVVRFLPHLTKLFSGENSTPKHMKIYHRTFLVQLLLRLGLQIFLSNFSTLLVEAVAGYKDYIFEDLFLEDQDRDAESIGSYSQNEDDLSNKSDKSEESKSLKSEPEDVSRSVEHDPIASLLTRMSQENTESISDLDTKSISSQNEESHRADSLQFQSQDEVDEFEESSRPRDLHLIKTQNKQKLFSPIGSKGMVRSETDEFAKTMSDKTAEEVVNINHVAAESIKWLSGRLGPLLTAKYLSRNLIRMLALCYLGEEQLISIGDPDKRLPKTSRLICGDRNANKIIECLSFIAKMYGEQVVILQYIPCAIDMLNVARKRLTQRAEAGLVSALVLLRHILPLISDKTLMDILQDTIIKELLRPAIRIVSNINQSFPGGSTVRTIVCHKLIDVVYVIGLRLGFEMTRSHLTSVLSDFFRSFNQVHESQSSFHRSNSSNKLLDSDKFQGTIRSQGSDDTYCNIKMDTNTKEVVIGTPVSVLSVESSSPLSPSSWNARKTYSLTNITEDRDETFEGSGRYRENIKEELENVFTPELAYASYIPFCRIFGSIHIEQHLPNEDLIRHLCSQYDVRFDVDSSESGSEPQSPSEDIQQIIQGNNREITGNRIQLPVDSSGPDFIKFGPIHRSSKILKLDPDEVKCDMKERSSHLKGNWLLYWEHELGLSERDTLFNFKHIRLHSFEGHSNSVRSLTVLNNENSFISASKDKTVKLWSIKCFGDGTGKSKCQMTYHRHKKSIFSVVYLDSVRLVATCDSSVHIWDPFTGEIVRQLDSSRYAPITAMVALPAPSPQIITATNEASLKYLDLRAANYAHEFKTSAVSAGLIRSVTVDPENCWIAIGFSTGYMTLLDQRTGILMATWKGHEGEILQLKSFNRKSFISTSFDGTVKVWNVNDVKECTILKGHTDPVHCFAMYKGQVISATTGNKIGIHSSTESQASFTSTKLPSTTFRGVLTSMAVLPLNKTLLLGADNGSIRLLC
ncbi:hypothetical protein FSP39_022380 [Pinctada imbricata]|uniref:BEACH domain-containing protein n=1 Tax=Pinctada imbricata TaxID=66713 RepID=A0AA89C430_PINIB|nr:hypothetical protein FSP39_022380 [Pinctada imbricata]